MDCKTCQHALPDLLLDPGSVAATAARMHLSACPGCTAELAELNATFAMLDEFHAPEPSPFFDQKLAVRLREAQAEAPAGWMERLQTWMQLNTGRQFRPVLAGALALVLLVSGGTAVELNRGFSPADPSQVEASATINDLQILDRNDQALQQMDQLLQDEPTDANGQPIS